MKTVLFETNFNWDEELQEILEHMNAPYGILSIVELQFWNGTTFGYQDFNSTMELLGTLYDSYNIKLGLDSHNLVAQLKHHDGTHNVTFRAWKGSITRKQKESLLNDIYNNDIKKWKISRYTESLKEDFEQWL